MLEKKFKRWFSIFVTIVVFISFLPLGYFTIPVNSITGDEAIQETPDNPKVQDQVEQANPQESSEPILGCTDSEADNYNSEADEDDGSCQYPTDVTKPEGYIKFIDQPVVVENNKTIIQEAGDYFISKISDHGQGGKLYFIHDGVEKFISEEYNDVPDYTYLGYFEVGDELIIKLEPRFGQSPDEVFSTDPERTIIKKYGENTFRYNFEDWKDADFNDLVLEVAKGVKQDGEDQSGFPDEIDVDGLTFITSDTVDVLYRAVDPVNTNGAENRIVAIQFYDEKGNKKHVKELENCNNNTCPFTPSWQVWGGGNFILPLETKDDGVYTLFADVVDAFGNITRISNTVIKDTKGPSLQDLSLSMDSDSITETTYKLQNYLNFAISDKAFDEAIASGLDLGLEDFYYSISFDGVEFGDWQLANYGQNQITVEFEDAELNQDLTVFIKVKDPSGNISEAEQTSIKFFVPLPSLDLVINNEKLVIDGQKVTNQSAVLYDLNGESVVGLTEFRVAETAEDLENSDWQGYGDHSFYYDFSETHEGDLNGDFHLCSQTKDQYGQISEVSCDAITINQNAPTGSVEINSEYLEVVNDQKQVSTSDVELLFTVVDNDFGGDGLEYRISGDGQNWSSWQAFEVQKTFDFEKFVGDATIYVQYRNKLGTESEVYSDSVYINPFGSDLEVLINNGDEFTDSLDVEIKNPFELNGDLKDVKVRILQSESSEKPGDDEGWGEWRSYSELMTEILKQVQDDNGSSETWLHAQYGLPLENGEFLLTEIYSDSIKVADQYGVEYVDYQNIDFPENVYTSQEFAVDLQLKNVGSLSWCLSEQSEGSLGDIETDPSIPQDDSDCILPVGVTYYWQYQNDPVGLAGVAPQAINNITYLTNQVDYNQESETLTLNIVPPEDQGNYRLVIDTLHEGQTWFSNTQNNIADNRLLTYNVDVKEYGSKTTNPNEPTSCSNPHNWYELRNERTESTKTYLAPEINWDISNYNPESYQTILCSYTDKIHYMDPSTGWWENVNSHLIKISNLSEGREDGYVYRNKANDFAVFFGDNTDKGWWYFSDELDFKVEKVYIGDKEVEFANAVVDGQSITYPEVLPGVDLMYTVTSTGVRKELILKDESALNNDLTKIDFEIRSNKKLISPDPNDLEGNIKVEGVDGLELTRPITFDVNIEGQSIEKFEISGDSRHFIVYPNQDYLTDPERTFPIIIDPEIKASGNCSGGQVPSNQDGCLFSDVFVRSFGSAGAASNYGWVWFMSVGGGFTNQGAYYGNTRSYMQFEVDSKYKDSIAKASLNVYQYATSGSAFTANIYRLDRWVDENSVTWNTKSSYNPVGGTYGTLSFKWVNVGYTNPGTAWIESSDIGGLVRDSMAKHDTAVLIAIQDPNESINRGVAFCSKEKERIKHMFVMEVVV